MTETKTEPKYKVGQVVIYRNAERTILEARYFCKNWEYILTDPISWRTSWVDEWRLWKPSSKE